MANEYEESDESEKPKRGRPTNAAKLAAFHAEARAEFSRITAVTREGRKAALRARRFVHVKGSQWEGQYGLQFANRPRLEIDKIGLAIDQITTDFRENQIDVSYASKDGAMDKDLAETCERLYRSDAQDSDASEAHGNCFEEGISGGMGAFRMRTGYQDPYVDEDDVDPDEPQRIVIEPIYDADRFVFFDLDARKYDKSDARRCYVLTPLTREEYERRYPKSDFSSWPDEVHSGEFDWAPADVIYVAEVFDVEWIKDVEFTYKLPMVPRAPGSPGKALPAREKTLWKSDIEDDPDKEDELLALGYKKSGEKKRNRKRIHKYTMDGMGILEDEGFIVGCEIPVVVFYAKRYFIDNVERFRGHVEKAMDAQMLKNMMISKLAEFVGVSSPEKPYMTQEQVGPYKEIYANDNLVNNPYLPIMPTTNADGQKEALGPVAWTKNSAVPPALAALHQQVDVDSKEILSTPDPAGKVVSHTSGPVMQAAQRQVDAKSALYIDNMGKTIRWSGQVWLGMAPEVYYQNGRKLRGMGQRGEISSIELNKDVMDENSQLDTQNDLSRAKFDVAVEVGPSSESEEEAAIEEGMGLLGVTEDPELKRILLLNILMTMRGPGRKGIQKWARRELVKLGVEEPTPEEAKALEEQKAQQKPTPIDQLALAQAKEAEAKANNSDANRALTIARVDKTHADTMKVLADVNLDHHKAGVDAAKTAHDMAIDKMTAMQSTLDQGGGAAPSSGSSK